MTCACNFYLNPGNRAGLSLDSQENRALVTHFNPSLIAPKPARLWLDHFWPPADGTTETRGCEWWGRARLMLCMSWGWHFDQACSCLLKKAIALRHDDASQQVAGLQQNNISLTEHREMFSFYWHKVDVSLLHVRKARQGAARLRCHVTHASAS